jgi:hypothetical protein
MGGLRNDSAMLAGASTQHEKTSAAKVPAEV